MLGQIQEEEAPEREMRKKDADGYSIMLSEINKSVGERNLSHDLTICGI